LFSFSTGPTEDGEQGGGVVLSDSSNVTVAVNGHELKTGCRLQVRAGRRGGGVGGGVGCGGVGESESRSGGGRMGEVRVLCVSAQCSVSC